MNKQQALPLWAQILLAALSATMMVFAVFHYGNIHPELWVALMAISVVVVAVRVYYLMAKPNGKAVSCVNHEELRQRDLSPYRAWLHDNLRGQDQAIDEVYTKIARNLYLSAPRRHLGSFLLVGPTGTGKTFLAKLIGEALFPNVEPLYLPLNQFVGPTGTQQALNIMLEKIRAYPTRVVIFDEIDQADRTFHHALYQLLDNAELVDPATGEAVDFSGCVFFATTNGGVDGLRAARQQTEDAAQLRAHSLEAITNGLSFEKPFASRWESIVLMDQLALINVAEIALLVSMRYWKDNGIAVKFTEPEMVARIVSGNKAFREYGVRQLSGYVRELANPAIESARRRGLKRVILEMTDNGSIVARGGKKVA